MTRVKIVGVGRALPPRVLTNADLEAMVDTSDQWIVERTGIRSRRVLDEGLTNSDLAAEAGRKACEQAGVPPTGAMYVGDNPALDLEPARQAGMITVHHNRSGTGVGERPAFVPDYVIQNFYDLLEILERDFGIRT